MYLKIHVLLPSKIKTFIYLVKKKKKIKSFKTYKYIQTRACFSEPKLCTHRHMY